MYKKLIAVLLSTIFIISVFGVTAFAATGTATYTVGNVTAAPGGTVDIPIFLSNNIDGGFAYAYIGFTFDVTNLTYQSARLGADYADDSNYSISIHSSSAKEIGKNIFYLGIYDHNERMITTSGEFAVLTFLVADSASGDYEINLKASPSDLTDMDYFVDSSYTELGIIPTIVPGKITVGSGGDPEPTPATYTITPVASVSDVEVGDIFTVDVAVSADDAAATFAAVTAQLDFDSALVECTGVTYGALTLGNATTGGLIQYYDTNSATVGSAGSVIATYTFEAIADGTAVFSIASGAKVGKSGSTAEIPATVGADATVVISAVADTSIILNAVYKGAPTGFNVVRYATDVFPGNDEAYFYGADTVPLFYAGTSEGKYVFVGFVTDTEALAVSLQAGTTVAIVYDGDINGNDTVNAIDALITHELANGVYAADMFELLSAQQRFEADVNGDGVVDAADARAIIIKAIS